MATTELESEKQGESDFLATQADDAQDAIKHVIIRMKEQVTDALGATGKDAKDIATETYENHTLVSLGAALAGGFLAGTFLIKSKEQKLISEFAKLEKAMQLAAGEKVTFHNAHPAEDGLFMKLIKGAIKQGAPGIISAIAAKAATASQMDGGAEQPSDLRTEQATPS